MRKTIAVVLTIAIAAVLFSGCGRTIKTKDGSISLKDGSIELKGNDGSTTTIQTSDGKKGGSLPDNYPENLVPLIDGYKIVMSGKNTKDGKAVYTIIYECNKEIQDAGEFYKKVMDGTEDSNVTESEELIMLSGVKDKYNVSIIIARAGDEKDYKADVTISVEEK